VAVPAGVQQHPRETGFTTFADPRDEVALVVRLTGFDRRAALLGERFEVRVDLRERDQPVDRRLPRAEQLQIRPGDDEDAATCGQQSLRLTAVGGGGGRGRGSVYPRAGHDSSTSSFGAAIRKRYRPLPMLPPGSSASAMK
jgi:hypothetical protein